MNAAPFNSHLSQSAAPPLIQPQSGLSLRQITASLQAALAIHRAEAREKLTTGFTLAAGEALPWSWQAAMSLKQAKLQIDDDELQAIVQAIKNHLESDLEDEDLQKLTSFGACNLGTFEFIRAVPYKDGIYAIHESTSDSVPGLTDVSDTEEGPWQLHIYEYEQHGHMAGYAEGCLKIVSRVVNGECIFDPQLNEADTSNVLQMSEAIEKLTSESHAPDGGRLQEAWPLWSASAVNQLLSLTTSTSAACIDLLDELKDKHNKTRLTREESVHVNKATASVRKEMDELGSQIRALENRQKELRDLEQKSQAVHQLAYFGMKEGDLVKHIDAPEVAFELRLASSTRSLKNWEPALYPVQNGGHEKETMTIDMEAVKRGQDFLGELRLGEWSKIETEQAEEDEAGDAAPTPAP